MKMNGFLFRWKSCFHPISFHCEHFKSDIKYILQFQNHPSILVFHSIRQRISLWIARRPGGGALTVCLVSVAVTTECKLSTKKSARPFTARRGSSNLQQLAEMNRSDFLCLWNRRKTVKCSLVHLQKIDFYFWFVCFFFYIPFYSWPFLNTFNMVFVCVCDPFA